MAVGLHMGPDARADGPQALKIALLRSVQEAVSTATGHAGGRDVQARVWAGEGMLRLEVADRGPGFSPDDAGGEAAGHLGLAGIRERAEVLGGSFELTSAPGRGTTIRVGWPLTEGGGEWAT